MSRVIEWNGSEGGLGVNKSQKERPRVDWRGSGGEMKVEEVTSGCVIAWTSEVTEWARGCLDEWSL